MIASIRGTLQAKGTDWVNVELGGITLHISVPSSLVQEFEGVGNEVRLHTRLIIRDDEPQLYGFPTPQALRLFQMLTGVSGIGPRTALNLLSFLSPEALASAIIAEDLEAFTGVQNIGKKNAARIVLELKGKLERDEVDLLIIPGGSDGEAVSALTALGYTAAEARRALDSVGSQASLALEEKVRRALAHLGDGG